MKSRLTIGSAIITSASVFADITSGEKTPGNLFANPAMRTLLAKHQSEEVFEAGICLMWMACRALRRTEWAENWNLNTYMTVNGSTEATWYLVSTPVNPKNTKLLALALQIHVTEEEDTPLPTHSQN